MHIRLPDIFTFWDGEVTWLERLCFASIEDKGHKLAIYSTANKEFNSIFNVVDFPPLALEYLKQNHISLFTDIARLLLMQQGKGIWFDADCILLKPIEPSIFIAGWMSQTKINNAVLLLPKDSTLLNDYLSAITEIPVLCPWATPGVRLQRWFEWFFLRKALPNNLQRMSIGPRALTYFIKRSTWVENVSAKNRFYSIIDKDAHLLVDRDDRAIRRLISEESDVIHACHGKLKQLGLLKVRPVPTSYLGQQLKKYGL